LNFFSFAFHLLAQIIHILVWVKDISATLDLLSNYVVSPEMRLNHLLLYSFKS